MKEQTSTAYWHEKLKQLGIIVIIPSYNNGKTLADVITSVRFYAPEILASLRKIVHVSKLPLFLD